MIGGSMGVVDWQCARILGEASARVDCYFDRAVALDDVSAKAIKYLQKKAAELDLTGTLAWLKQQRWGVAKPAAPVP